MKTSIVPMGMPGVADVRGDKKEWVAHITLEELEKKKPFLHSHFLLTGLSYRGLKIHPSLFSLSCPSDRRSHCMRVV